MAPTRTVVGSLLLLCPTAAAFAVFPAAGREVQHRRRAPVAPCASSADWQQGVSAGADGDAAPPADQGEPGARGKWGDDSYDDPGWGSATAAAPAPGGAWADGGGQSWTDDTTSAGSWGAPAEGGGGGDGAAAADWLSPAAVAKPARKQKPIETTKVGIVMGPYKRRNGYHAEVAVQHPAASETMHRLWFGFEVVKDIAKLRGKQEVDIDVDRFSEAVLEFLKQKGVDLADPDWGMQDDDIPFSTEFLPLRTVFSYYQDMPEALAAMMFD